MITSKQALAKYGPPENESSMTLWDVPSHLEIGVIPKRIYCNKAMVEPLTKAFENLISRGRVAELKTWDGVFNIRKKKSGLSPSLHSWGLAIDVNSFDNQFGKTYEQLIKEGRCPFSDKFLQCFRDAGFDCGGDWSRPDRMHFQLREL